MADEPQTGVVVVALPAADDPVQGIGPEQKHATLLYFGDIEGGDNPNERVISDAGFRNLLGSVLSIVASEFEPFTADVSAVESLGQMGARVWKLGDGPLQRIREELLEVDSEVASALEAVEQYPTYTPHVTIGYPDDVTTVDSTPADDVTVASVLDDPTEDAAAAVESIAFDRLALWWAGEQIEFPLIGIAEAYRRPGGPSMPKQLHESTRLVEVDSPTSTATRKMIQIITPGWGSSGYYSAEVLERAAKNRVIPAGTKMYLNHASVSERSDRPERDVEKIASVLVEDAIWDGTRLMAPADVMGPHAEMIESLAPYIGVSISGSATDITIGEAEGRRGPIIEDLAHVDSVDYVTQAGRGGMVLLESARPSLVNALAVEHGIAEATANETREQLQNALRELFPGEKVWVWVRDFDDSTVWYEHETTDEAGTYSLAYSLSDAGVTFSGSPVEVRAETNYVPVSPGGTTDTEEAEAMAADPNKGAAEPAPAAAAVPGEEPVAESSPTPTPIKENDMTDTTPGAGGIAAPTNPREVMEAQMREQGRQIALLRASQQAGGIVREVLAAGWIGEAQAVRLTNELIAEATLPLTDAGELDEAALRARALARLDEAETEAAEILASAGVGQVKGLGSTTRATEVALKQYDEGLAESFKELGLSETAVQTAVKGR